MGEAKRRDQIDQFFDLGKDVDFGIEPVAKLPRPESDPLSARVAREWRAERDKREPPSSQPYVDLWSDSADVIYPPGSGAAPDWQAHHEGARRAAAIADAFRHLVRADVDVDVAVAVEAVLTLDNKRNRPPLGQNEVLGICRTIVKRELNE